MTIPPYFPEQIELPGNVASEPYRARLQFLRATTYSYFLSVVVVFASIWMGGGWINPQAAWISFGAGLLLLTLIRRLASKWDTPLSFLILPPTLVMLGSGLRHLLSQGWPIWSLGIAALALFFYAQLCGKDYSFVGQFVIGSLASLCGVLAVGLWQKRPLGELSIAFFIAEAYLFYYVYDLAALQTRRRKDESFAAATDLYRDLLNFLTYGIRVIQHWRQFRI